MPICPKSNGTGCFGSGNWNNFDTGKTNFLASLRCHQNREYVAIYPHKLADFLPRLALAQAVLRFFRDRNGTS